VCAYLLLAYGDAGRLPGALAIHQDGGNRPYLETHGELTQEMVDPKSAKPRAWYEALGASDRWQSTIYDAQAHVFRADMAARSYAWLDRWQKETTG
jgi:hypothetical protein